MSGACELCAAECRGHRLGHPEEWEPEIGSRAYMAPPPPHREGCECEECWHIVYVSPPRQRFVAVDPASPTGGFSAEVVGERLPDGRLKIISVAYPTERIDWMPRDLMGPPR